MLSLAPNVAIGGGGCVPATFAIASGRIGTGQAGRAGNSGRPGQRANSEGVPLKVTRLAPAMGAEITGINLAADDVTDHVIGEIRAVWAGVSVTSRSGTIEARCTVR